MRSTSWRFVWLGVALRSIAPPSHACLAGLSDKADRGAPGRRDLGQGTIECKVPRFMTHRRAIFRGLRILRAPVRRPQLSLSWRSSVIAFALARFLRSGGCGGRDYDHTVILVGTHVKTLVRIWNQLRPLCFLGTRIARMRSRRNRAQARRRGGPRLAGGSPFQESTPRRRGRDARRVDRRAAPRTHKKGRRSRQLPRSQRSCLRLLEHTVGIYWYLALQEHVLQRLRPFAHSRHSPSKERKGPVRRVLHLQHIELSARSFSPVYDRASARFRGCGAWREVSVLHGAATSPCPRSR